MASEAKGIAQGAVGVIEDMLAAACLALAENHEVRVGRACVPGNREDQRGHQRLGEAGT